MMYALLTPLCLRQDIYVSWSKLPEHEIIITVLSDQEDMQNLYNQSAMIQEIQRQAYTGLEIPDQYSISTFPTWVFTPIDNSATSSEFHHF